MDTLSKAVIAEALCNDVGLARMDAKEMTDQFFDTLKEALTSGHHVKLSGFGNFSLRDKSERPGRNPKTGVDTPVLARRVVTFRPGLKLRGQIVKKGEL